MPASQPPSAQSTHVDEPGGEYGVAVAHTVQLAAPAALNLRASVNATGDAQQGDDTHSHTCGKRCIGPARPARALARGKSHTHLPAGHVDAVAVVDRAGQAYPTCAPRDTYTGSERRCPHPANTKLRSSGSAAPRNAHAPRGN